MKYLNCFALLLTVLAANAQDSLKYFNTRRIATTETGMLALGGWGAVNTAGGAIGWASNSGKTKYFYQMNTIWGVVNLSAAFLGYAGAAAEENRDMTAAEILQRQKKIEHTFLINGGLDIAYIGAGLYVNHRGNVNGNDKQRGYGQAVIMQGGFLLLFDSIMYGSHKSNGNGLRKFFDA